MTSMRDLMSPPAAVVGKDTPVRDVARVILENGVSGVPVTDSTDRLLGVITAGDVVAKHAQFHLPRYLGILGTMIPIDRRRTDEELRHILAVNAGDLMRDQLTFIGPEDPIEQAASLMVEEGLSIIPVVENGRLVGVVDERDIIRIVMVEEDDGAQQPAG